MKEKCKQLYTDEEINRIIFQGDAYMRVDVHGMSKNKALHFIQGLVLLNNKDIYTVELLHGYNRGTAIKDALASEFQVNRNFELRRDKKNPGITRVVVNQKKAA